MKFMDPSEYAALADPETSNAEAFEERAAIMEHMAGMSRESAEQAARPVAAKFTHHVSLYTLRCQASAMAAKKRSARR